MSTSAGVTAPRTSLRLAWTSTAAASLSQDEAQQLADAVQAKHPKWTVNVQMAEDEEAENAVAATRHL